MSFKTFPINAQNEKAYKGNPAIQLFGNRLYIDQTSTEYLVEFLILITSKKNIDSYGFTSSLPPYNVLMGWNNTVLKYTPKARLNLKLFSFLGASKLDSRHKTHREHHKDLLNILMSKISMAGSGNKEDVVRTLENLFLGFQGAGGGRTWCAQSFLPVCPGFLAGESIWNETAARKAPPTSWSDVTDSLSTYLTMNKHRFLARGGEVLYLQICNALRQPNERVQGWVNQSGVMFDSNEQNPEWLHAELERELNGLIDQCPATLTEIAEFIDSDIEPKTSAKTDGTEDSPRYVTAGWCPTESWQEGYLFAVDLLRLCKASLDVIDRLYLLESACAMHVLRSLAMQSVRYTISAHQVTWPGYRLAVSAPKEERPAIKRISQHTAKMLEKKIFQAIRSESVDLPQGEKEPEKTLKEADRRYAGKLFVGLAKRIGLIVPRRGAGARFVLNEQLLRLLVVTTVPVGGRITFDTFKKIVELHYGLVFDADGFSRASEWIDGTGVYLPNNTDAWLQNMLEAAGFLIHLSDSCALVENPAANN